MTPNTPLDRAFAASDATEAGALRFYQLLADTPLLLVLDEVASGTQINPRVFDLEDGPVLLAFDSEDRLGALGLGALPYAELPGRIIARHLAGKGVALGLNFGCDAPSETMLSPDALSWLAEMVADAPETLEARPESFFTPRDLPAALTEALNFTFAAAPGLADAALLVGVHYDDGRRGHMLAVIDAGAAAQEPLARAIAEALRFSGLEAGEIDVTFVAGTDPVVKHLARSGILFEFPHAPAPVERPAPLAPGMDPGKPPKLR